MASPFPIQQQWIGIDQDSSRDQMRAGSSYNLVDYIPARLGAPIRKRGGRVISGRANYAVSNAMAMVAIRPPDGTNRFLFATDGSNLYGTTGSSAPSNLGAINNVPLQNPIYFNSTVVVPVGAANAPNTYDGTTLATMGGTPPNIEYSCAFKGRLVGSKSNSVYFAPVGWGPAGVGGNWDTTFATSTTSAPLRGLASMASAIIVFHQETTERLRGTIPFGTTNSDMVLEPLFQVGCLDAFSVTQWNNNVVWASRDGVFMTDGAALTDLTAITSMKTAWRSAMSGYAGTYKVDANGNYRICSGVYRDQLLVTITDLSVDSHGAASGSAVDCFVFDLAGKFGYRFSNQSTLCFASPLGGSNELYVGSHGSSIGLASDMWTPTSANETELSSTGATVSVLPTWESTYYRGYQRFHRRWVPSMGLQRWQYLYLSYVLTYSSTNAPTLTLDVTGDPEAGSTYRTTLTPTAPAVAAGSTVPGSASGYKRVRIPLRFPANGISVRVRATGDSSTDLRLYALEADYAPVETSRLA